MTHFNNRISVSKNKCRPMDSDTTREFQRKTLEEDTKAFLDRGGVIDVIPYGVCSSYTGVVDALDTREDSDIIADEYNNDDPDESADDHEDFDVE